MLDLLMKRRSIRKYEDREISKETIDNIIKGALTSPSGRNLRPWELIVVTDKDVLKELGKSRGQSSSHIADAPLGIVIAVDPTATDIWIEDATIIATTIMLTASSYGLGTCWIQARKRVGVDGDDVEGIIKNALDIPAGHRVECMIAIGYPDEKKSPYNEKTLPYEKVHYNKF